MQIKLCGITQWKQMQQLDALPIDFVGLIFYQKSPRFVGDKLDPKQVRQADFEYKKVGVFVDETKENILKTIEAYGLDAVQLHGDESPELCEALSEEVEVIKAFSIDKNTDIDALIADYDEVCDYYLFDTLGKTKGGTGEKFDWKILKKAAIEKPFFLSGGIGVEDIEALKAFKHPDLVAVDINSKFETEPGVKDMATLLKFTTGMKKKSY